VALLNPIRTTVYAGVLAVLVSCSSSHVSAPPSNQDNICSIFAERPEWREAIAASASKWGAPVPVQMAIIWRESNFRGAARPPKKYILGVIPNGRLSSAYGYAQAIDGTWDWYRKDTGNSRADRTDFEDAADFVGWYMSKTVNQNSVGMHDRRAQTRQLSKQGMVIERSIQGCGSSREISRSAPRMPNLTRAASRQAGGQQAQTEDQHDPACPQLERRRDKRQSCRR